MYGLALRTKHWASHRWRLGSPLSSEIVDWLRRGGTTHVARIVAKRLRNELLDRRAT